MTLNAGARLDRYEIRRHLARGGMGEVYLAHDTQLDRTVAVKVLPPELAGDAETMRRFVHEAKAASALNHPNILTVFDAGRFENTNFIAVEFIDGMTLRDRLRQPPAGFRELVEIGVQTASALAAAHSAGIVHRDVKPENIMIRHDGYVKVVDFGLAKLVEPADSRSSAESETVEADGTRPGVLLGTPTYMSPEQARGSAVDARTDVWSLGVVLYEMVAGRTPFERTTMADGLAALLDDRDAPPLARYAPEVPPELQRIVSKAIVKDPARRYQTMKDLELDLRRLKEEIEFGAKAERETISPTPVAPALSRPVIRVALTLAVAAAIALAVAYRSATGSRPTIDSIAVLPLENVTRDSDGEYLTEGLTESLINRLSQLPNVRVAARSSVFRYKGKEIDLQQVARELGVRAILTGRVTQRGDNLSISVELTDANRNSHLWGETYNRVFADLQAIQTAISREISDALHVRLTRDQEAHLDRRDTDSSEAHRLYLKGLHLWNQRTVESLKQAIQHFNGAIEKDPEYALAYSGLANSYLILGNFSLLPAREAYTNARAAARRALEEDNRLAEAHTALAFVDCLLDVDWPKAEKGFRHAIDLNPNYGPAHQWSGVCLAGMGRMDEAIAAARRAREVDPLSSTINAVLGWILYLARRYDEAIQQELITLQIDPGFPLAHRYLGLAYEQKGMYDEAVGEFQKAMASGARALDLGALGHVYAAAGRSEQARKVLADAQRTAKESYFPAYEIALIHAAFGDKERAFEWLDRAHEERDPWLIHLNVEPRLDSLRGDRRFRQLADRIGLPQ